jgi:hypothetical protein
VSYIPLGGIVLDLHWLEGHSRWPRGIQAVPKVEWCCLPTSVDEALGHGAQCLGDGQTRARW